MSKQRAKFRGYAQGKGYQNFDPGYAGLSRQQERDSREISDLKENLRDIKARDSKQETALDRANRITAESRDAAYSFVEDRTYQMKQDSLAKNRATEEQNFRAEQGKIQQEHKNLMSLVNFSETLVKSVVEVKNKNWDATAEAAYNYYMNNGGLPIDRLQATDAQEDAGYQSGELIEKEADELAANGGSPKAVNWIRHKNSAAEYGRMKALAVQAGNQFGEYATQEIIKSGLTKPNEIKAKLNEIQIDYLKANGLYDPEKRMAISADFLGPTLGAMAKSRNAIVSKYESLQTDKDSQNHTQKYVAAWETHKTPATFNRLFEAKAREWKNGKLYGRKPEEFVFEYLGDPSQISPEIVQAIKDSPTSDGQMTWGERFPLIFDKLDKERLDTDRENYLREKSRKTIGNARLVDETFKRFLTKGDFTNEELQETIDQLELSGADTSKLKLLQSSTIEGRRNDFWEDHFEDLAQAGTLRASEVMRADVPREVREKYLEIAQEYDTFRKNTGTSDKDIRKVFNDALRDPIKAGSLTSTPHFSLGMAEGAAFQLYNKKLVDYSRNSDPKAHENAMNFVLEQIQQKKGDFHVTEVDMIDSLFGDKAFFSHFTPGNHANAPQVANPDDFDKTLEEFQKNPNLINEKPIIDQETLELQADNIRRGLPITIPPLFYELSNASPERYGTATDILKGQFKAAKIDVDFGKDFRVTWANKTDDGATKKFLQKIQTKQEAVLGYKIMSGGTRNPEFMNKKINLWTQGKLQPLEAQPGTTEYSLNQMLGASEGLINNETVTYKDGYIIANTPEAFQWLYANYDDYGLYLGLDHAKDGHKGMYFAYDGDEPI